MVAVCPAASVAVSVTVVALTTVQLPVVAVQVPGSANNCAGNRAVRLTLCATAAPLVTVVATPTIPPGPKHFAGSVMLEVRLPTLSVAVLLGVPGPPLVEVMVPVVLFLAPTVVPVTLTLIVHEL